MNELSKLYLLAFIGINMIKESFEEEKQRIRKTIFAIATANGSDSRFLLNEASD